MSSPSPFRYQRVRRRVGVAAVVMSTRRHEALLEEIEDLRDRLSIHEREGLTADLDKVAAELGL